MGKVTVTGAILIITGWFALVEFDSFPESERKQILQRIKRSPVLILLIALMPAGIFINMLGVFLGSLSMMIFGASLIFLQGVIVALLFWKRKRWKSIVLLAAIVMLGIFIYIPLLW
ncbi:hypothetical protein JSQ81_06285 [Sporosarcina sp. Marseille-Q4063]|uniref:hypothetical protein n=1 Tax=Sporosarcina sp. Marseille-Q4063 TaxID=2810514 RepID=UPI001BB024AD|nr:hypothetical protein [Sporosarcina sp. Marseille-Q4063]QUW23168.1 hypothetical protein JSQ81_06285 [Sporosarcina sp. Marseille-Q4063]